MKGVIIYKGRHGATKLYADWLAGDLQMPVFTEPVFSVSWLDSYDLVVAGGSVYAGRWTMQDWLVKHASRLKNKKLVFFIVCGTPPGAIDTLEDIAKQNIPPDLLNTCKVFYLHGRMVKDQLSWSERWLLKIGAWLTKDPVKKKQMTADFDDVKKEYLSGIITVIRYEQAEGDYRGKIAVSSA
jgi:menaquinone-dependent protoporphyrinogen IX oxidase